MIIKTLGELAEPDEASLLVRPLDLDPANLAEEVAKYQQSVVASFELLDGVPQSTKDSYERVRTTYCYGIFCYDLYTVAADQARLVVEQALRDRFLPFYYGQPIFLDVDDQERPVTAEKYDDLYGPDRRLVKGNWKKLQLRSGREPIRFNGMLTSLLRWARAEGLLGGQRDRMQDHYRVRFRNYTAHSHYYRGTQGDAESEILHLANLINRLWGASSEAPVHREPMVVCWTAKGITYGPAAWFTPDRAMSADATCAVVLADPRDLTIGNSFDARYELTARPCRFLWGPGTPAETARWLEEEHPVGDEVPTLDRLFVLRSDGGRLYMPQDVGVAAGLDGATREGTWYLLRADHPHDAFRHQMQMLLSAAGHDAEGFCRSCPAESLGSGTLAEMVAACATMGADVTPQRVPELRSPMCWTPRLRELPEADQEPPVLESES